jgi:hypothetical protein
MKKIGLLLLSIIAILSVWVSFADIIPIDEHRINRCSNLKNVEIDNYKVIYAYIYEKWPDWCWQGSENICQFFGDGEPEFIWIASEYNTEKCLPVWDIKIYLLDETESTNFLTQDNINEKAIYVWSITVKEWGYVNNSNPLTSETFTYEIIKTWSDYTLGEADIKSIEWFNNKPFTEDEDVYDFEIIWDEEDIKPLDNESTENETNYTLEIVESEQGIELASEGRLMKFWIAWILTILIETIVLFIIAKLFRKEDQISNWRLLLIWILASSVTLPLLRFVLPLFVTNETIYITVWELAVTLVEIFIIKYWLKISWWKAIVTSIACNLCSFLFWLFIF